MMSLFFVHNFLVPYILVGSLVLSLHVGIFFFSLIFVWRYLKNFFNLLGKVLLSFSFMWIWCVVWGFWPFKVNWSAGVFLLHFLIKGNSAKIASFSIIVLKVEIVIINEDIQQFACGPYLLFFIKDIPSRQVTYHKCFRNENFIL